MKSDDIEDIAHEVVECGGICGSSHHSSPIAVRLAQTVIDQRDEARDCAAVNKVLMERLALTEQAVIDLTAKNDELNRAPYGQMRRALILRAEAAERKVAAHEKRWKNAVSAGATLLAGKLAAERARDEARAECDRARAKMDDAYRVMRAAASADIRSRDRADAAERARDAARTAIKQALVELGEWSTGDAPPEDCIKRALGILAAANCGLQLGESNAENPQGPTVIETNTNALGECHTCGFDVRTDVHSHRCRKGRSLR